MQRGFGKLVTPGDILGVEEEYIPVSGAYIDEQSYIRSQVVGVVYSDAVKKSIVVKPVKDKPLIPKPGDIVEGVVFSVSDDLVFISIYSVNNKYSRSLDLTGLIHISQASTEFVHSMYELFHLGEVVRAKVLNSTHPYQLTTKEPGLGVIVAFCSRCGSVLHYKNGNLVCPQCGSVEKRKVSAFYMY